MLRKQNKDTIVRLLLLLPLLLLGGQLQAQVRGSNIVVTVVPDHQDWNYRTGETASFTVNVRKSSTLLDNVQIDYETGPSFYPDTKKSATLKNGTLTLKGSLAKPGFYTVKVKAHVAGRDYEGQCTAAFSPEKIVPYAQCPKDFDAFWEKALREARQTDLNPTQELLADRCTKDCNVYQVSFQNDRWGRRVYGVLTVPKAEGSYPALLRVPGAGVRPYAGDTYTAPGKCIVLEIGIHGVPVTLQKSFYTDLNEGALFGYWETNLDNPDKNYYRHVVTGAVKAVDFIATLPQWNGRTLGVTGSSQGGFLSLATAALDSRVTFLGVVHDAMCDYEAETHGVAGGWPHYFYQTKADTKKVEGARYYDGVNFAKRLRPSQQGWFSFGYNDEVVPPTSSYGTYNIANCTKTLSIYQQTGHYWYQEQWDEWQDFITQQLTAVNNSSEQVSELTSRLQRLQQRGYMAGHQDDPFYGLTWAYEKDRSDVKDVCGDYPAVMGFDLGGIEMGDAKNLDSVPFTLIREEATKHVARGGIITFSWHPRNPLTGGTAWDVSSDQVVKSVLAGGSQHAKFQTWMERVADFLLTLKDSKGAPLPIIFRPWHENNGSWFWWGQKLCTDADYRALWNALQDYLTARGLDNLLWSYSPNLDGAWTTERFLQRYPGDDRVTLIGEDAYQWGTEADFKQQLTADLDFLQGFAKEHGKLLALTECGLKNMTDATWWTRVLKPIMDSHSIAYFLLWRNDKNEFFGPAPGHPAAADWKTLYKAKNTLFLKDIKN